MTNEQSNSSSSPRLAANLKAGKWDIIANTLFLKYILTRLSAHPLAWGEWGQTNPRYPVRFPHGLHDSPQAEATRVAVWHKNLFAEELASLDHRPTLDQVKQHWLETCQRMERDIAERLASL